ncbi:MAG: site-specific recombinase [Burkholderiales bacterium]|nr:site-specific recombinase [Burkholderiales bacterium]
MVRRHLWLIAVLDWIRGDATTAQACVARVERLLDALQSQPETLTRVHQWWQQVVLMLDGSTLLADYGFASRNALVSEFVDRLHLKLLPSSPETQDASELFALAMPTALDAQWIAALPEATLLRVAEVLSAPANRHHAHSTPHLTYWQCTLLDALTFVTSQVRAAGFSPEIRLRMGVSEQEASPFHGLATSLEVLHETWLRGENTDEAAQQFKAQLESCRHYAATVYTHLDTYGISVDLVFRLRQLRERLLRIRTLLDCLLSDPDCRYSARLVAQLVMVGQERTSLRALFRASSSLLAAKVAERSSVTGEHYITRNRAEYHTMLRQAAGGGALTALTTALKFAIMALGLASFWSGFWSGVMYAASFVLIQLMHFTLATKQPAMTAPAMAAKLKDLADTQSVEIFVDEVSCLVRSQVAAVAGNVVAVFPVVILLSLLMQWLVGEPMIDSERAHYVLDSLTLAGPSLLFAAFTGVLLFASSIIGGWVENWFVLHRLDSALRYNPRVTRRLGAERADRLAHFMLHHISGFASNVSLGFMLGLVPSVLAFVALPMDVRHVTLSTGQLAAACASLGFDIIRQPALWWALASLPLIGVLNVGVSFYMAFRVALQAHSVTSDGRATILRAIGLRLRRRPGSFFWPQRQEF